MIKEESSESEEEEEEDERENVLSFRNAPLDVGGYADGVDEGDLGLGSEGKRTYQVRIYRHTPRVSYLGGFTGYGYIDTHPGLH